MQDAKVTRLCACTWCFSRLNVTFLNLKKKIRKESTGGLALLTQPSACSRMGAPHLEGGISHLGSKICIKFELLVIQWKSALTCLTWDYGLWGHSAKIPGFWIIPYFPDISHSFLRSRGQGKDTCLNFSNSWRLKVAPSLLSGLYGGMRQSEPWVVWAKKGTTKSFNITVGYRGVCSFCIYVKEILWMQWILCKPLHALM